MDCKLRCKIKVAIIVPGYPGKNDLTTVFILNLPPVSNRAEKEKESERPPVSTERRKRKKAKWPDAALLLLMSISGRSAAR